MSDEPYDRDEVRRRLEALGTDGAGAGDAPDSLDPLRRNSEWDGGAASGTPEERQRTERMMAALEASAAASVLESQRRFEQSGNPVYVWIALMFLSRGRRHSTKDGALGGYADVPAWCTDYLVRTSLGIFDLAIGKDQQPPAEAMDAVTRVLGLTDETTKYNAFRTFRKDGQLEQLLDGFQRLRADGLSWSVAMTTLAENLPAMDPRTLEKKIAAAQRLMEAVALARDAEPDTTGKT